MRVGGGVQVGGESRGGNGTTVNCTINKIYFTNFGKRK